MALRVLLADNSETIKKVIQLTLQDFEIDLRIVTHGIDVLDVALKFKPDIIFVDILLQKKSGYEVSKELKNNVQMKNTPVVLMWSGFMEFDEPKAKESLADARLEKPFDAETLKNLVNKLVKKGPAPDVANFLDFPPAPTGKSTAAPTTEPKTEKHEDPLKSLEKIKNESEKFKPIELPDLAENLDANEEPALDEFEMQPLTKTTGFGYRPTDPPVADSPSINQQTKSFVLDIPEDTNVDDIPLDIDSVDRVEDMSFLLNADGAKHEMPKIPTAPPAPATPAATSAPTAKPAMPSDVDMEKIVREEVRTAIDKVIWQVVPELAAQLIKKELDRLLQDNEPKP
jgi:two-component system cell cycle response regulator